MFSSIEWNIQYNKIVGLERVKTLIDVNPMEIKIDTSKDDVEHIKHMITFLQHFVNQTSSSSSTTTINTTPVDRMFGMFGGENETNTNQETPTPAPSEGIFGLFGEQDTPNVQQNESYSSLANDLINDKSLDDEDDEETTNSEQKIEIIPY